MTSHDSMNHSTSTDRSTWNSTWTIRSPLGVALAVALLSVSARLVVDHGPWNKPHLHTALINYGNTSAAAQAVGARILPTEPKSPLEPDPSGPKPVAPVNQVAP
jgi:hypothetical protein